MTYELAKELKETGFPQREANSPSPYNQYTGYGCGFVYPAENGLEAYAPTLTELIEACGEKFGGVERLSYGEDKWGAYTFDELTTEVGFTPEEAVAHLWLALNKKE